MKFLIALLCLLASPAWGTIIQYSTSHLGGTQWRYDYTVSNDSLATPIEEFSVFFETGLYANLHDASTAPGWDRLLIQPDPAIPAAGYFDALALASGIAPGATQGGFAVVFDYLGAGLPPPQAFSLWDPLTSVELDTGTTTPLATLPLASTSWLLLAALLRSAWRRRRAFGAMLLAATLAACGGDDKSSAAPAARLLSGTSIAGGAVAAATQFEVTALEKTGEQRVNRTTYDYTYRVSVRNNGPADAANLTATLTDAPAGTTIVSGTVTADAVAAGATVVATGQVVLRIDRTLPFNAAALVWSITADDGVALEEARPAEVYILPLADLGFADGADSVTASGAITEALLKDGTLRFATPGDTGADQQAQLLITRAGVSTRFRLLIRSELPTAIDVHRDGSENTPAPPLLISGLGPNNTLTANGLRFHLQGAPSLDLKDDSNGIITGPGNALVSLKPHWIFNAADGSFSIGAAALAQLLGGLPNGALNIALNFVSKDGAFAEAYKLIALKAAATVSGKLVNSQGGPVTGLAGRKVLLQGFNARLRRVANVDANGSFSFTSVIPDTYQITLVDLAAPNVVSIGVPVFAGSTAVNVTLVYPAAGAQKMAAPALAGSVTQDGAGPARRKPGSTPAPAAAVAPAADGSVTFTATAAAQNQSVSTPINFNVPKGTSTVGVKITVQTDEYPVFTTQQSQYNDTWSYSVTGLPGAALSASGAVNQSHFTQGTTTKTSCVDVAKQAKDAAFDVGGAVSATNIGDDLLPTRTTVELSLACAGLKVTLAKFTSPNKDAHPVLQPINLTHNLPGPYLSVAQNTTIGTHTLPLEIQYAPPDAAISEVHLSISPNAATPNFAATNLLTQMHTSTPGKLKFSGVSLPAFATSMGAGKVAVMVRIKGKVQGTEVTSDPAEGGEVAFKTYTAFIPLSLAGDDAVLSGRRTNGSRDVGGDSWATRQTMDWLLSKLYRFDDISGQHVTQTAGGGSILVHSGHSDGQQIDLRYADGQGGYSDSLGGQGNGAAIQNLINAAAAEVAANAPQKPQLAVLVAWIAANRGVLDAESASASTRIIYIGPDFIKRALVDGKFSAAPNAQIPGVAAWTLPARVQVSTADHLSHWHISLNAHP